MEIHQLVHPGMLDAVAVTLVFAAGACGSTTVAGVLWTLRGQPLGIGRRMSFEVEAITSQAMQRR
jgi:hypothetical protein